jgi:rhodanese-related sulfurtransferase
MTGTGTYLRKVNKNLTNLGVFTAPGDRVPGPRPIDLIQSVDLPWKEVIDREEHVNSYDSYAMSLKLCREGILCGPSSGLALKGLYQFLARTLKEDGNLDRLRGCEGEVNCVFLLSLAAKRSSNALSGVFICCDYPFQYISEYFTKLDYSNFPKIHREELLEVDKYMYGIDWKLSPADAWAMLKSPCSTGFNITVDLRDMTDYQSSRVINSFNLDLKVSKDPNPFLDSATLVRQWNALMTRLDPLTSNMAANIYCSAKFILICYSGYTASIACSILRHRGVIAYYVVGGFEAWHACNIPIVTASAVSADF